MSEQNGSSTRIPIYELEFVDKESGRVALVRFGYPVFDVNQNHWVCVSEVIGLSGGEFRESHYSEYDLFLSIEVEIDRFRKIFEKAGGDFRSPGGTSAHSVFPRQVPWVYGSDVYWRISAFIDNKVQAIEDERTRRREENEHHPANKKRPKKK